MASVPWTVPAGPTTTRLPVAGSTATAPSTAPAALTSAPWPVAGSISIRPAGFRAGSETGTAVSAGDAGAVPDPVAGLAADLAVPPFTVAPAVPPAADATVSDPLARTTGVLVAGPAGVLVAGCGWAGH